MSDPPTGTSTSWTRRVDVDLRWGVVLGLVLIAASAAAYEIVPASVNPLVMDRLGIDPVAAGWLVSVVFWTGALGSLPTGVAVDRIGDRVAIAASTAVLLVAAAWGWQAAAAGAYWSLMASRVVGGLGFILVWNAGAAIVAQAFDVRRRATAVGLFTASGPAGYALGQFTGPLVAGVLGWAAVFGAFGALAVVGFLLFWATSRGVVDADADGERSVPARGDVLRVLVDRGVWTVALLAFLAYALYLFLNSWMPTYLTETTGLTLAQSGLLVAVFPATGVLSRTGGGVVSDRVFGGRRRPVAVLSFLVAAPAFVGFLLVGGAAPLFALLVVSGLFIQLGIGLFYAYVRELVDPAVATTSVALLTSVGLAGAASSPVVAGFLIERTGSYRPAFAVATGLALVGLLLAWLAPDARA